jgi:hypothetical protein
LDSIVDAARVLSPEAPTPADLENAKAQFTSARPAASPS